MYLPGRQKLFPREQIPRCRLILVTICSYVGYLESALSAGIGNHLALWRGIDPVDRV